MNSPYGIEHIRPIQYVLSLLGEAFGVCVYVQARLSVFLIALLFLCGNEQNYLRAILFPIP